MGAIPMLDISYSAPEQKVQPLFERIFVQVDQEAETSPSGLIIPKDSKDMITMGTVLAVGTKMPPNSVSVGDRIIFQKHAGIDLKIDGETVRMMMVNDVFARFPNQK